MLAFFKISFVFLLCGSIIRVDSMPSQDLACSDENLSKVAQENDALKAANEILKIRLELQQLSFEQQLMKMQCYETKKDINSEALLGILKTLGKQFLTYFEKLVNVIKDQGNLEKNNSLNRNNELLNVLNRIDSKVKDPIPIFSNCAKALQETQESGVYTIELPNYKGPFQVYCDALTFGGGWTVIQRRQDGSVNFYRNWINYKNGIGNLSGEFFMGLDKLHALTTDSQQELLIELEDFDGEIRYAKYDEFAIGDESEDYKLKVLGSYSGNAGDSLSNQKNMKFSTKDRDNDKTNLEHCAKTKRGAWWYKDCQISNLNGLYLDGEHRQDNEGIEWYTWRGNRYSYRRVQMLIRPKGFENQ